MIISGYVGLVKSWQVIRATIAYVEIMLVGLKSTLGIKNRGGRRGASAPSHGALGSSGTGDEMRGVDKNESINLE